MVEVVAAFLTDGEKFLICRRPPHKARGLLWEFVGGKTEKGESKEQALKRECKEELDVEIEVGNVLFETVHEYPDLTVKLTLFSAKIVKGEPKLLEHYEIKWIKKSEIDDYEFCGADGPIIEMIKRDF